MTIENKATATNYITQAKEHLQFIGSIMVVLAGLYAMVSWATGGLRPNTQVLADNMSMKLDTLQHSIGELQTRLDAMPRTTDFTAQDNHLSRIDGALNAIGERLRLDELDQSKTSTMVEGLRAGTGTPLRRVQ